ncbi:MAG: hypothetical protein U9N32_06750 [Spirochaetota bacterium]|nr:hypothetical protein [Spirochaetota bacterium]
MIDIFEELKVITSTLKHKNLEYALCGGLAMAVYNISRATIDIDIIVLSQDILKIKKVLADIGYTLNSAPMSFKDGIIKIDRVSRKDNDSEDFLSVDIIEVTKELETVWNSKSDYKWESGTISVISKEGLIYMKQLRGSGQDQDDIEKLR